MDLDMTLAELCQRCSDALTANGSFPTDGRVRARPDERTVRYYTTLGLVDRPTMRGRSGRYHHRHLLQLVAIKRLQATGSSLAEVQARLMGLTDPELEALARLEPGSPAAEAEPAPRRRFWAVRPEDDDEVAPSREEAPPTAAPRSTALHLAPGTLLLLPSESLAPEDIDAIQAAAAPLLDLLRSRGLTAEPH